MKVSTILAFSFVNLSAAAGANSIPIEQSLQALENGAKQWDIFAQAGLSAQDVADNANYYVRDAIRKIREAVEESAKDVYFADGWLEMNEDSLRKAKNNLGWASEILNPENRRW